MSTTGTNRFNDGIRFAIEPRFVQAGVPAANSSMARSMDPVMPWGCENRGLQGNPQAALPPGSP